MEAVQVRRLGHVVVADLEDLVNAKYSCLQLIMVFLEGSDANPLLFCSVKDIGKKSSFSELFKLTELLWATWD